MTSFAYADIRIEVLEHHRVRGDDFPTPQPGAIADYFVLDLADAAGRALALYPNQEPPQPQAPNRLTMGWIGDEAAPVFTPFDGGGRELDRADAPRLRQPDVTWRETGTRRGGDFRRRFFTAVARRTALARAASQHGLRVAELTPSQIEAAAPALDTVPPLDLGSLDLDNAVVALTGAAPRLSRRIPQGTTVNIDAASLYEVAAVYPGLTFPAHYNSSNLAAAAGRYVGSDSFRGAIKFSLAAIPVTASINSNTLELYCYYTDGANNLSIGKYNGTGSTDPSADYTAGASDSTLFSRCKSGSAYLTGQTVLRSTGSKTLNLGSGFNADVPAHVASPGYIVLGVYPDSDGDPSGFIDGGSSASDPPTLTLDYTLARLMRHPGMSGGMNA